MSAAAPTTGGRVGGKTTERATRGRRDARRTKNER